MMKKIDQFRRNNKGATAIEYALIASLISIAAISTLTATGGAVSNAFDKVGTTLVTANP